MQDSKARKWLKLKNSYYEIERLQRQYFINTSSFLAEGPSNRYSNRIVLFYDKLVEFIENNQDEMFISNNDIGCILIELLLSHNENEIGSTCSGMQSPSMSATTGFSIIDHDS